MNARSNKYSTVELFAFVKKNAEIQNIITLKIILIIAIIL